MVQAYWWILCSDEKRNKRYILKIIKHGWISRELGWIKNTSPPNYVWYDSTYITFSKWQSYRDRQQISGCQGLGRGMAGWWWWKIHKEKETGVTITEYSRGDVCGDGASLDCEVDCTNLQNLIKLHQTLDMHSACKTSKIWVRFMNCTNVNLFCYNY